jgi:hypothetical protein
MVILLVFGVATFFAVSTYLFMVVISLIGRRFFVTRWFLDHPPPSAEDDPSAHTTSNA